MVEFLNPKEILNKIPLKENMTAADFGCGSGGWVIPLAQKLEKGRVFAIDVLEEPLSVLESTCKERNIVGVKTIVSDVEKEKGSTLNDETVDLVLLTNLLFQVEDREKVLKESKRVLKKGGMILIVDWKKDVAMGPEEGKISSKEVREMADNLDLKLEKEIESGNYHYALVFRK
jgi:ubiquinone/menaquinone biosynthesis C-methylase UbiE